MNTDPEILAQVLVEIRKRLYNLPHNWDASHMLPIWAALDKLDKPGRRLFKGEIIREGDIMWMLGGRWEEVIVSVVGTPYRPEMQLEMRRPLALDEDYVRFSKNWEEMAQKPEARA